MIRLKESIKKLLQIEDTPERTALAYSIGIFLGFSPFLGLHTISGIGIAFLFGLNRIAVLLGVWTNTPWGLLPYYTLATWLGTKLLGYKLDYSTFREILDLGTRKGFLSMDFWNGIYSQKGLFLSFNMGSLLLSSLLALIAYPLSLKWIKFYRSRVIPH